MTVPTIHLRAFQESDLDFFTTLAADERVTRFVGDGRPWTDAQVADRTAPALRRDAVDQVGAARWFVAEESGRAVGVVVSTRREHAVEVGYWVAPQHWGRGAAGAMLDHALELLPGVYGTTRLSARVAADNTASTRALLRRSFQHQGRSDDGLELYLRA